MIRVVAFFEFSEFIFKVSLQLAAFLVGGLLRVFHGNSLRMFELALFLYLRLLLLLLLIYFFFFNYHWSIIIFFFFESCSWSCMRV
jgi:hypothetical protein